MPDLGPLEPAKPGSGVMRIAVDVMGGDHGCGVVIQGAINALKNDSKISTIYLVGPEPEIKATLAGRESDPRLQITHASEFLTMEDKPVAAVRKKKDCSILRAVELVKDGKADAVVSVGNTGGIFAAATFKMGRLPGVDRGCIATVIPTPDNEFVLLDSGANIDCTPLNLAQYAVMGSVYSREILGYSKPRVGVLSIGREETKGTALTLEVLRLCKLLNLNFIGNIEGHDLFHNEVDVVICDGFVGNIVLKTCESLAMSMFRYLKRELTSTVIRKIGAKLSQGAFRTIRNRMDPDVYGGAPLLGFNGAIMKAHGSAREKAITSAIGVIAKNVNHRVNEIMISEIADANRRLDAASAVNLSTNPA